MHKHCIVTEALQPGMVIVQVTKQNGALKIRKSGLVTSVEMIQGLIEMGIQEVQIDPTQTVEIDSPVVQSSATMQLLQSGSGVKNRQDSQLHDQFNRSLFLPSVQDIPSAWQFYARRYGLLSVIILCGFVVGFAVAYVPSILSLRSPLVVATAPDASPFKVEESQIQLTEIDAVLATNIAPNLVSTGQEKPLVLQTEETQAAVDIHTPAVESVDLPKVTNVTTDTPVPKQEVIVPAKTEAKLSPELLKRFEKVIKQMDQEAAVGQVSDDTLERYHHVDSQILINQDRNLPSQQTKPQDVPRIDQLPAWVMNELPSMSFSAHMYASNPADRWVRVNGQRMLEGDLIDNKVSIVQINSQQVILNYQGHQFSMQAMTDW